MSGGRPKPSKPFGLNRTPFLPQTGAYAPVGDVGLFQELTIVGVGHNVLLCSDRDGRAALVLKPWLLRASTFDDQTRDGVLYNSTAIDERDATIVATSKVSEEIVTPGYFTDEKIMAYRRVERDAALGTVEDEFGDLVAAGDHRLFWEDMNLAGRRWEATEGSGFFAEITGETGGIYDWTKIDGELGPDEGEAVEINETTGIDSGTKVFLHRNPETGEFFFFFPVAECE